MDIDHYPSKYLEAAVNEFSKLPGIGRKTALRLVLYLLRKAPEEISRFGETFIKLKDGIRHCHKCHNISDTEICSICNDPYRNHNQICVVENIRDVIAIEHTQQFNGVYHVLGGLISPMDGIGPGDIEVNSLEKRINESLTEEVILALSTTMEGDTTNFYIYKKLKNMSIKLTTLARGVSFGDELEYADDITLGRSIQNRTIFEDTIQR